MVKPILFIGDSNLSRIPTFTDPNIQVDSFPGAQFHHLTEVIGKLEPQGKVKTVVLAVGLNNGLRGTATLTNIKQLNRLVIRARFTFPNATLHIPIIQYHPIQQIGTT